MLFLKILQAASELNYLSKKVRNRFLNGQLKFLISLIDNYCNKFVTYFHYICKNKKKNYNTYIIMWPFSGNKYIRCPKTKKKPT